MMYQFKTYLTSLLVVAIILTLIIPVSAEPVRVGPVQADLVAKELSIQPGRPFEVGLYIVPDEDWHVYWQNPGDAGLPPSLEWSLPDGFTASEIIYPAPERIDAGPLTAYGYHGDALYPVTIRPPNTLTPGDTIHLQVKADWLVCKVECLPGKADLSLSLPVKANIPEISLSKNNIFSKTDARIPLALPQDWLVQASQTDKYLYLDLQPSQSLSDSVAIEFFADKKAVIEHAADQPLTKSGNNYRLQLTRSSYSMNPPDSLLGVLAVTGNGSTNYYTIEIPFGVQDTGTVLASTSNPINNFLLALMFAFLGGLILNLMPCVLPVLSLKVLGLVQQASKGRKASFLHGLLFTLGVLVSFWVIVGVMFILQAGGAQLGWGFQLQSPTFVMILAAGMFLFALSLFGLFEIGFLVGTAGTLATKQSSGLTGAFISGVTATLVATPCTAPFMGAALGYSLTQPPVYSFSVYTFLALGMASPYLLLAIFPNLLKFVPKPGRWMETLKQAMGFLLAATVIWLGWVLASQAGSIALVVLMGVLLMISIAAWIYGRWGNLSVGSGTRWTSRLIALGIIVTTIMAGHTTINQFRRVEQKTISKTEGIAWEPFSQKRLAQLRADGSPVFIDFTAAWCLSCQVNEKVAFSSEEVQDNFKQLGIVPLKADWTNRSDEIAQALAEFGRNSVPLYVLYNGDVHTEPTLLPEILTPGIVLEALSDFKSANNTEPTYLEEGA